MDALTNEKIAELRRCIAGWQDIHQPGPWNDITRALDELEQFRSGAISIRLEEDGKSVPFSAAAAEVAADALAKLERTRALLRRIEWGQLDTDQRGYCPACGAWSQGRAHKLDCELALLIGP